jgi:Ras-related protein Rab-1A
MTNSLQEYDAIQKIIFVGDSGAGKTSLLTRYIDKTFTDNYYPTIGVDFKSKIHESNGLVVKLQIWDNAGGRERYRSITHSFYRGANGAFLCFDLTDKESFSRVGEWLEEVKKYTEDACIFLIGTKGDQKSKVPADKITLFAVENHLQYFQMSSKTGENVEESIDQCIHQIIEKNKHNFGKEKTRIAPIKKVENESVSWCNIS